MRAFKHRFTLFIAGVIFLISFALPSYDGRSGFECAMVSVSAFLNVILQDVFVSVNERIFTLYIGLFNITNVFTVFLLIKNSIHPERHLPLLVRAYYVIVILCTASWWGIALASGELNTLGPGYYIWLLSIVLLGIYNWIPAKPEGQ